jgi:putative PIN family toxin of toxin-antitoxin system
MKSAGGQIRVVVDTNLFVSGLIFKRGYPFELVRLWRCGFFKLVISKEQQEEIQIVLGRPYFAKKYEITNRERIELMNLMMATAEIVSSDLSESLKVRDSKDEVILASALNGEADFLVTGDEDLLVLRKDKRLAGLQIVTVREFLERLSNLK